MKISYYLFFFINFSVIATPIPGDFFCTYLDKHFTKHINKDEVKSIIELGSLHGFDAIALSEYYNCHVFTFECDPERLDSLKENIKNHPKVTLVPYGAWNETIQNMKFYHSLFWGASSFFEFDLQSLSEINHNITIPDLIKEQNLIMVPKFVNTIRLDEWMEINNIAHIDLMCIDVQGATLRALIGMGKYLKNVKYIIAEIENKNIYKDEALFPEVNEFLKEQGFECLVKVEGVWGDWLFINKNFFS